MESDRPYHAIVSHAAAHRPLLPVRPRIRSEVVEAQPELKALQRCALELVDPETKS
jgi:hypothetical protein